MTDKEKSDMKRLLQDLPWEDLVTVKRMIGVELDARQGKTKFQPQRWDAGLSTR